MRGVPILFACLIHASTAVGGVAEGVTAIDREDWEIAEEELAPAAAQGDPVAQYWLGHLYLVGGGVELDRPLGEQLQEVACRGFLEQAETGDPTATGPRGTSSRL